MYALRHESRISGDFTAWKIERRSGRSSMLPVFGHLKAVPSRSLKQHPQSPSPKTILRFVEILDE
jgi:hypothetical protein